MNHNESQLERTTAADGGLLAVTPRVDVRVRAGTMADVAFMDSLQKATTKQVGWMPTKQFEGKIAAGHVLVAEAGEKAEGRRLKAEVNAGEGEASSLTSAFSLQTSDIPVPVGYLIGQDQYFKRDDVGIIYQMNVLPAYRRSLVAATLLKAQFERSAYGCKLYCCWCAQDIEANKFWEAMGFVALAFRSGGETRKSKSEGRRPKAEVKSGEGESAAPTSAFSLHPSDFPRARTHIFWQKRIRQGDHSTPWWFPSKTAGGAMNADRIVLPIPPGVGWRDAMPVLLPEGELPIEDCRLPNEEKATRQAGRVRQLTGSSSSSSSNRQSAIANRQSPSRQSVPRPRVQFGPPGMEPVAAQTAIVATTTAVATIESPTAVMAVKPARRAKRADPAMIAAARELRDRWLDEVNAGQFTPTFRAKYQVSRVANAAEPIALPGRAGRGLLEAA